MRTDEFINEIDSLVLPTLNVGDDLLTGKFKNSPAEIKGFTKDKHNQPVLKTNKGNVQLFKPRITKLMPKKLDEYESGTENSKAIFKKLEKLGYARIGSGQDATVWSKDDGHVIKILMPSRTIPSNVSTAERGFLTFYNFCQQNKNLPNLPKFIDIGGQNHSVFEINGTPYRQIAMEKLQHMEEEEFPYYLTWMLSDLAKTRAPWNNIVNMMKKPDTWSTDPSMSHMPQLVSEKLADPVLYKQYGILYLTMGRLYDTGLRAGLGWDLHTDNIMERQDGTLVIVDPFYT